MERRQHIPKDRLSEKTSFAPRLLSDAHAEDMDTPFEWALAEQMNIGYLCCGRWADVQPDRLALIHIDTQDEAHHWEYGQIETAAIGLRAALKTLGLARQDRIALMLPQSPETIISHIAGYYSEAIILPLFSLFGLDALSYRLKDSATRFVITDSTGYEKLCQIVQDCPDIEHVIIIDSLPDEHNGQSDFPNCHNFWQLVDTASPDRTRPDTSRDDPAIMIYTSGTTGSPKGALHAHRFLLGHLPNIEISHNQLPQPDDIAWTPADWAWIGGLMDLALPALYYGVPLISHRMRKFDAEKAFQLIATYQIRNMFLPPTALKMMQAYNLTHSLPEGVNIRTIASGGEALPQTVTDWANTQLGVSINEIYGQTECNLVICTNRPAESCPHGFMGKAVPGHELAIFDGDGKMLPAGEIGQIGIASPDPVMFLGYWGQTEKTQAKFHGKWLMTGDLAVRNEDGFFRFVSRDDDIISSAGYRIGPTEIENCLISHKDIVNAGVIGLPDALKGEAITAIIVPQTGIVGTDRLAEELKTLIREKLSPHMCPKHIFWTEELPLTTTGKVMRRELRAYYADTHKGS